LTTPVRHSRKPRLKHAGTSFKREDGKMDSRQRTAGMTIGMACWNDGVERSRNDVARGEGFEEMTMWSWLRAPL